MHSAFYREHLFLMGQMSIVEALWFFHFIVVLMCFQVNLAFHSDNMGRCTIRCPRQALYVSITGDD